MAYHNEPEGGEKPLRVPSQGTEPPVPQGAMARRLVAASWAGTMALSVSAVPAAISPGAFVAIAVVVSLSMFGLGIVAFLVAYAVAIGRSRAVLIGMGGLFFLAGSAPRSVRRSLWASLGLEVVVAVATASTRVFTPLAFGVLAPMYGLGVMGMWGACFGTFDQRTTERS